MLTGSIVLSLKGEPRLTHDLDVVVAIAPPQVPALLEAFRPPRFHISPAAIAEAIETGGMFNILEATEGDRVDFRMLTDEPFDRSRFARRCEVDVFGIRLKVSSPEDTILAKLRWAPLSGGSEKQFQDAVRVYEVQAGTLDLEYIADRAARSGVTDAWKRLQQVAEIVE